MEQQEPKKQCPKCHLWLPYSAFGVARNRKDGMYFMCKECNAKYRKELDTSLKVKKRLLRSKYNITLSQYDSMFAEQGGVCAICKQPEKLIHWRTGKAAGLAVDHDHNTGDVRALLCQACNTSLGLLNEDPERIRALLNYVEWCQTREPDIKIIQLSLLDVAG